MRGIARRAIHRFAPGLAALGRYDPTWFRYDLVAGVSVAAIAVPIAIAYSWYGRYYVQSSSLLTFALNPAVAYRLTDWLSLGAGSTVLYGQLKQKAAINNNPLGRSDFGDGQLKIEDKEFGLGGNAGVLVEPLEGTRLGLTYRSEIELEFKDVPELEDVAPWLSDLLGRTGQINDKMDLSLTLPQEVMFSFCQELFAKRLAIMGSVGWQDWSQFSDVSVAVSAERLGKGVALKTKFQDTWHYAIGAQYRSV